MYKKHFGLSREPFSIAPNPRFLYMSRQHREALAHLVYGVRSSDGFAQLTGEVGTGKTTICRCLVERLPEEVDVALILNPRVTALELVATLCDELKIGYPKDTTSIKVLTDLLNAFLLENHAAGRRTVLIIDEAQCLSAETLEQVRLLTNLETATAKLLQVILVGQPELRDLLAREDLRQLAQRITARFHLMPFSRAETAAYIRHRLELSGARSHVFNERVIDTIHRLAKGIPRLINVLCDRAMLGAFAEGVSQVDMRIMRRAAAEVLPVANLDNTLPRRMWRGLALALTLGVGLAAGLWYGATQRGDPLVGDMSDIADSQPPPPAIPPRRPTEAASLPAPPASPEVLAAVAPHAAATKAIAQAPVMRVPTAPETVVQTPNEAEPAAEVDKPAPLSEPVAAASAPTVPPSPAPSLTEHLATAGADAEARAWAGLYRLWGYASTAKTEDQACAQAAGVGLSCLKGTGSWGLLRRFDRPAMMALRAGGRRLVQVVLQRADDDQVTLEVDGRAIKVARAELEQRWEGAYRLLWKKPPSGKTWLPPGGRGADVRWLRERLGRLSGQPITSADPALYDQALEERVAALQDEHGLDADGIAGPHTLIVLNNLLLDPEVPHLAGRAEALSGSE